MTVARVFIADRDRKRGESLAGFLASLDIQAAVIDSLQGFGSGTAADESLSGPALVILSLDSFGEECLSELSRLKKIRPRLSLILLSRARRTDLGVSLLRKGLIDQFASPDDLASVYSAVKSELAKRELAEENSRHARELRRLELEQSKNRRKAAELEEIHNATLENLMTALDLRDVETFGHSLTVAKYSQALARILGIRNGTAVENIRKGALLHDIGKIAIPDVILKKPTRLSAAEWEKIKLHPVLGHGLIKEIKLVREIGNIILYHHERYDGKGYPRGLKKEAIPLEARIFAVADALDAITSYRPYRRERDFKAARKGIQENRASQFDPQVVDAFCSVRLEEWERIRYETTKILPALENFSELFTKT
ncbi:MAG: HD domain-containing protein [Candidatus Aminicenantes bacterium]|nr:HD domain-containing protein [Candidatus Aminicenantes bacterium]